MGNKVFVGGIPWAASDQDLRDLFSETGEVTDAVILQDRETGKSRGFGFVTYASDDDAKSAVEKFNGHDFMGRELTVNEARPREERSGGGGGGYGGGGGGGGRGGGGGGGGRGGGGRRDGGNNKRARRDFEGGGGGW